MSIPDRRSWGASMRYIGVVVAVYEGSGEERRDRDWRKSAARGGGGQGLIGRVTSTLAPNGGYAPGRPRHGPGLRRGTGRRGQPRRPPCLRLHLGSERRRGARHDAARRGTSENI